MQIFQKMENGFMFKVGDRVRCNNKFRQYYGDILGTVVNISNNGIGVKHDEYNDNHHTLNGLCEDGYGWFYVDFALEIAEVKIKDTRLARKIYKNCIKREEDGYLYVQG